jgi:hypothetical protein
MEGDKQHFSPSSALLPSPSKQLLIILTNF